MPAITKEDLLKALKMTDLNLSVNLEQVDPEKELINQGLDSLDMTGLLFEIESFYKIEVDDESLNRGEWKTLNNIVVSINQRLG